MAKKIPVRQCVACREHKEKGSLARIVRTPEGQIKYDTKGKVSGRGAYICKSTECLAKAIKSKAISRALETDISQEVYDEIKIMIEEGNSG